MIRILHKETKRTKTHIKFMFDHEGEIYNGTLKLDNKLYETLSDKEVFSRVRGKVLRERNKLTKPEPEVSEEVVTNEE